MQVKPADQSLRLTGFQLFCRNSVLYGLAVLLTESLTAFFQPTPLVPLVF